MVETVGERNFARQIIGLSLIVDFVAAGALTKRRAIATARQIQASDPLHINERVLARFLGALQKLYPTTLAVSHLVDVAI